MEILIDPHEMLHTACRRDFTVTAAQIQEMFALMRAHNGIGLAAPQVGLDARLFVTGWNQVFHDPVIVEHSKKMRLSEEGCLSIPGKFVRLARWQWVVLQTGERFDGIKAYCIQHEMDHLDGILITDA